MNAVGWALFMLAAIFGWAGAGAWGAAPMVLAIAAISAAPAKAKVLQPPGGDAA